MPLLGREIDHATVTPRRVGIEYDGGSSLQRRQHQKQSQEVGDKAWNEQQNPGYQRQATETIGPQNGEISVAQGDAKPLRLPPTRR